MGQQSYYHARKSTKTLRDRIGYRIYPLCNHKTCFTLTPKKKKLINWSLCLIIPNQKVDFTNQWLESLKNIPENWNKLLKWYLVAYHNTKSSSYYLLLIETQGQNFPPTKRNSQLENEKQNKEYLASCIFFMLMANFFPLFSSFRTFLKLKTQMKKTDYNEIMWIACSRG